MSTGLLEEQKHCVDVMVGVVFGTVTPVIWAVAVWGVLSWHLGRKGIKCSSWFTSFFFSPGSCPVWTFRGSFLFVS